MNFKEIHIGQMVKTRVAESGIEISRICNFMKCEESDIVQMYDSKSMDTEVLLRWSKLLGYDFFRIYTQHLIWYAPPPAREEIEKEDNKKSSLPQFRKNIYTIEIIDFVLEQVDSGEMTRNEVIEKYGIPKSTLYKWISKYRN